MTPADTAATAEVALVFPITVDGTTYSSLTMRRPKVKDELWAARQKGSDSEKGVALLARLCDVSPDAIGELATSDAAGLQRQLAIFQGVDPDADGEADDTNG